MSRSIDGVVVEKEYLPPPGAPAKYWCYLTVETANRERVKVRLHQRAVDAAVVGDRVALTQPRRKNKRVRDLRRL